MGLSGELDIATAPALQEALHAAQHAETPHVIVDLRQLTFLDSFGLRILAAADIAGRDGHVKVSFIGGSDSVHGVFELTRWTSGSTATLPCNGARGGDCLRGEDVGALSLGGAAVASPSRRRPSHADRVDCAA